MKFIPFDKLRGTPDVALLLGCQQEDIERVTEAADQSTFYKQLRIPKRGARRTQFRIVHQANETLAQAQRVLNQAVCELVQFRDCVQAFVPGGSIRKNAKVHLGQPKLLHVDIEGFFDAIETHQVAEAFRALSCTDQVAGIFARLATLNGRLPQGSSASPAIANLVCGPLDTELLQLAGNRRQYTRYADDITISGKDLPDTEKVSAVLARYGFRIRAGSVRIQRRGKAQYVTGLSVSSPTGPHVSRAMKRRLRLELHYIERFGFAGHEGRMRPARSSADVAARITGLINFIHSVEPARATSFREHWQRIQGQRDDEESPQGSGDLRW